MYADPDLQWITQAECIRLRPGMYIGAMGSDGLDQLVFELFDNAADRFLLGKATHVCVKLDARRVKVSDDGDGLPFESVDSESGESVATRYLTHRHNSPTADGHSPHIHSSLGGCGVVVVNALSSSMICRSWRHGELWEQQFCRAVPLAPAKVIATGARRGTTIEFVADEAIFGTAIPTATTLRSKLFVAAHLLPGLSVRLNGEQFQSDDGLTGLMRLVSPFQGFSGPVFGMDRNTPQFRIIASACGSAGRTKTNWATWCNGFYTIEGGSHQAAFAKALRSVGWKTACAMIHVVMNQPQFGGSSKVKLCVQELESEFSRVIEEELDRWCKANAVGKYAQH